MQTQWRFGPAGPTGLDYSGVRAALQMMNMATDADLFGRIRLMERTALDCMAKAHK